MKGTLSILGAGMALAFTLLAYAHQNFATVDMFKLVLDRLDKIERKVDELLVRR